MSYLSSHTSRLLTMYFVLSDNTGEDLTSKLYQACLAFSMPVNGGNNCLKNDFLTGRQEVEREKRVGDDQ